MGPTNKNNIEAEERQRQAVDLRRAGATYDQIATRLGYASRAGAYKAVTSALKKTMRESTDQLRDVESDRLDQIQVAIWQQVRSGDLQAIDRMIRIMDRRAKLLGLDLPIKVAPTTPDGLGEYTGGGDTIDEARAKIAEIFATSGLKLREDVGNNNPDS